ncbi:MAG: hypothetical protein WC382_12180 [Methanoregulaceae archaeon]|jgi:hypothetical protein
MKKKTAGRIAGIAAVAGTGATLLSELGTVPPWLGIAVIVVTFPLFVLFLGLWWMARETDADIPFLGY